MDQVEQTPVGAREDHWADPGGQSMDALKTWLGVSSTSLITLELISSVEELRSVAFGLLG